jgi:CheY-like chemotaxis protein
MPYNVLIVDDDDDTAQAMASLIAALGHNPIITYGPRGAVSSLNEALPEIVLLDLNLPGVDGLEVCRHIRRDPLTAEIPVVVVSADDDRARISAAYEAGANAYLVKPAMIEDVEETIARLLDNGES